jgi:hypothetical protein
MKTFMINPFLRIAGWKAFFISIPFVMIKLWLSARFQLRFDGAIDAHFYANEITFKRVIVDEVVVLILLTGVYYLGALLLKAHHTRLQDILGTLSFARIPLLFVPLLNWGGHFSELSLVVAEDPMQLISFFETANLFTILDLAGLTLLLVGLMIWVMVWQYKAIAVSTNIKSAKMPYFFVFGLLIAEVLSLILLRLVIDF